MVYSDTTNDNGIVQESRWLVGDKGSNYSIKDITRNVNRWYDRLVSLILQVDGRWQWDDENQANNPIGTTGLVSGQENYVLSTSFLTIERVEVKDSGGQWRRVRPFDPKELGGLSVEEYFKNDSIPEYYDLLGEVIKLKPSPNYTQATSLKVWFQREGVYFLTTDTAKEAGFAKIFHRYLSLGAAYDYALKNNLNNRDVLKRDIMEMEVAIKDFYGQRNQDEQPIIKNRTSDPRMFV